jgi:hypothetical protein
VWLALGWTSLEDFRSQRLVATKRIEGFKDGNCFHDGQSRLEVVDDWLDRVAKEGPKSDNISPSLVHLVKEMLDETAEQRPDCTRLYFRTQRIIKDANKRRQRQQGGNSSIAQRLPLPETPKGPPPTNPNYGKGSSRSQLHSSLHSPTSPTFGLSTDFPPPSSPPDGDEYNWRNPQQRRPLIVPELLEGRSFFPDPSSPVLSRSHHPPVSTVLPHEPNGYGPSQTYQDRASYHRARSPSDLNSPIARPSFPPSSPTKQPLGQRATMVLGSPVENGKAKQKDPIPLWPLKDAFAWREQRKEHKMSLSDIPRLIGREPEKSKFAEVAGSDHLMELKDRDHVSF